MSSIPAEPGNIDPYAPQTFPVLYDNDENLDRQNAALLAAVPGILADDEAAQAAQNIQASSLKNAVFALMESQAANLKVEKVRYSIQSRPASTPVIIAKSEPMLVVNKETPYAAPDVTSKPIGTPAWRHYGSDMSLPFDEYPQREIILEEDWNVPKFVAKPERDEKPLKLFAHPSGYKIKLVLCVFIALILFAVIAVLMWLFYESLKKKI